MAKGGVAEYDGCSVRPAHQNKVFRSALFCALLVTTSCSRSPAPPSAPPAAESVADSRVCAGCHAQIFETYRRTGMGRSFYQPTGDFTTVAPVYHKPSGSWFSMLRRADGLYQRRWQTGPHGEEVNAEELKVDFVMGSGIHVRTFLHRTGLHQTGVPDTGHGTLIELPLAWYAERGGVWALNPGYDSERWPARRKVGYDCMFCHNAYPSIPAGHDDGGAEPVFTGTMPEGIDCQRCHGPGAQHVAAAQAKGVTAEAVRRAIVNPARLPAKERMEVCLQCHLETTSFPLPDAIRRFGRGPFSYRAGEPLSAFRVFFDHAPGTGHEKKFEIVSSAYRLRQSQCFLKSGGALTCTTCHNPHDVPHGPEAATHYNAVCRQCHASLTAGRKHTVEANCVECHMPKRRTDDVAHAMMTDHRIGKTFEPAAKAAYEYRGEVVPYYGDDPLYAAMAQLVAKSNVDAGIPRLEAELRKGTNQRPEPWVELGDAYRDRGVSEKAAAAYREAQRLRPDSALIARRLAGVTKDGELLRRAVRTSPDDAGAWYDLGLLEAEQGRKAEALASFEKAAALDPGMADAQNSRGAVLVETGATEPAEQAFLAALRLDPFLADAHANLAALLASRGRTAEAAWHFEKAVRLAPGKALYEFNYGVTLAREGNYNDAERHLATAVKAEPGLAEAHDLLGGLLEQRGQTGAALREYAEAVRLRPGFGKAQLDLGTLLANRRELAEAAEHFRKALADAEPGIRQQAEASLRAIGGK